MHGGLAGIYELKISHKRHGSCYSLRLDGAEADGQYDIWVADQMVRVYCDMTNGGWTRAVNILSTTPTAQYSDIPDAVTFGKTSGFYKLSDQQINLIAEDAGSKTFLYVGGNVVYFVRRVSDNGQFTSLRNQGGWETDRNVDGVFDCKADRIGFVFSDYPPNSLDSTYDCDVDIQTTFGSGGSDSGVYMANRGGWGQAGSIWVGGPLSINAAITRCAGKAHGRCDYRQSFRSVEPYPIRGAKAQISKAAKNGLYASQGLGKAGGSLSVYGMLFLRSSDFLEVSTNFQAHGTWYAGRSFDYGCHLVGVTPGFHAESTSISAKTHSLFKFHGWNNGIGTQKIKDGLALTYSGYTIVQAGYFVCATSLRFDLIGAASSFRISMSVNSRRGLNI